jgi:hypothetical protein
MITFKGFQSPTLNFYFIEMIIIGWIVVC